jgi:4-diphosphocytidyl-2-C-methyl-D-erythritol kinase
MPFARVASHAKLNLDLRVLHRRPDGYHEIRTLFQTISVRDTLEISAESARRTGITLECNVAIPDNLVIRAARAVLGALRTRARVHFRLEKRIPMGGGLGGGSSNAAAVLLALPGLLGRSLPWDTAWPLAAALGSDVPFFLVGGTAVGLGRGAELYPLADAPSYPGLLVAPGIHVSTPAAYRDLARPAALTGPALLRDINRFQSCVWGLGVSGSGGLRAALSNDFEKAVFRSHPRLRRLRRKLEESGAVAARMTGSGSALFGLYAAAAERDRAAAAWDRERDGSAIPFEFVSRRRYGRIWRGVQEKQERTSGGKAVNLWPPPEWFEA